MMTYLGVSNVIEIICVDGHLILYYGLTTSFYSNELVFRKQDCATLRHLRREWNAPLLVSCLSVGGRSCSPRGFGCCLFRAFMFTRLLVLTVIAAHDLLQ